MVESIKELRKICYTGSKGKRPLYMELVTIKVSIYITKLLLYTPTKADHVTISMILLAIFGSVFMAFGSLNFLLIGILIIHFTILLDNVNGEVARYRKEGDMRGSFLEFFYHEIAATLVYFSLGFGVFLQTGFKSALLFGFLSSTYSKSVVLSITKLAALKHGLRDNPEKRKIKVKKCMSIIGKVNMEGGSSKTGQKLYKTYNYIKEIWGHPFNIVHINILVVLEIINQNLNLLPQYFLLYGYLMIYGTVSVLIQIVSFVVHYRGKTVYHYYLALFDKK
jgi:phosphatidylglycerophosphate synthase